MSNKTLQVANTIRAFDYDDTTHRPTNIMNSMIQDGSIRNDQLVDSEITINGTPIQLGGSIIIHSGGTPVDPGNQSRLEITVSEPTYYFEQSNPPTLSIGVRIDPAHATAYSIEGGVFNVEIRDQHNVVVYSATGISSVPGYTVDTSIAGTINISATAQVRRTSDDTLYTDSTTAEVHVQRAQYYARLASAPSTLGDLGSRRGIFQNNESFEAPTGTNPLYIALPSRTGGYAVLDGDLRIIVPSQGVSFDSGNYLLYSTTEAVAGNSYVITEV